MKALIVFCLTASLGFALIGALLKDFARFDAVKRWRTSPLSDNRTSQQFLNGTLVGVANILLGLALGFAIAFTSLMANRLLS